MWLLGILLISLASCTMEKIVSVEAPAVTVEPTPVTVVIEHERTAIPDVEGTFALEYIPRRSTVTYNEVWSFHPSYTDSTWRGDYHWQLYVVEDPQDRYEGFIGKLREYRGPYEFFWTHDGWKLNFRSRKEISLVYNTEEQTWENIAGDETQTGVFVEVWEGVLYMYSLEYLKQ